MADDEEKEKSAKQILQALDALSQTLHKARATRRSTSLPLPRSPKDADDVVVDAADEEAARPQPRRRLSPMSPLRSRPKLHKRKDDDDGDEEEEEGANDESTPPKSPQEFTAVKPEDVMVEKKGVTSWGATRVLSHIGMRRFGCVFSVEVVSAQGAPPSMNGLHLAVNVRRKEKRDGGGGDAADFDEALYVRCSLYHGAGAAGTNKPLGSFVEPARQPFLLSVAVDGPDQPDSARRRSAVSDLSQFAMEVTDKGQQWDMVFPLATAGTKANKGGDLFVKLVFQRADVDGTYSQLAGEGEAISSFARKLRKSSLSNMLTPKMTRVKTPNLDVTAPDDLQGIDSFMLDEPKAEPVPLAAEVKGKEQEEPEPAPTPVVEVKEEEPREEEPEREPADEPTPVAAEVREEEDQKEPEPDAQDGDSELPVFDVIVDESVEGHQEMAELKEEADEEAKEESDEVVNDEATPSDVSDDVADAVEPADAEAAEEASVVDSDEVAKEVANELEMEVLEEATPNDVSNAVADAVEPVEAEAAGSEEVSVVSGDDVANDIETEAVEVAPPSDVSDAVADAAEPVEAEAAGSEDVSVIAGDLETEAVEVATPSDMSDTVADAVEVEPVDSGAAESEEASVFAGDEAAKEVANELDTEPVESVTPSDDVSDAVAKAVEPVEAEASGLEEVNGETQKVPEQGEDKNAATKARRRRRFGWRMLALVVTPVAVMVSKNLNVVRF